MAIEDSHPLEVAPDLVDQLTVREREVALRHWEELYLDANRLVHPNTRSRSPESIAQRAILVGVSRRFGPWVVVPVYLVVALAGGAIVGRGATAVVLGCCALVLLVTVAVTALRWHRRRRWVLDAFAELFPGGPGTLPAARE